MSLYDDHERIAFPLLGDDDLGIPSDILVDALIHAPASYGDEVTVHSISVTGLMVSIVFAIAGAPVAYLTERSTAIELHAALPLTPIRPGVSGFVAFGAGVERHLLRLDGSYRLDPHCLIAYADHLGQATLRVGGHELFGLVRLETTDGLTIGARILNVRREDNTTIQVLAAVIAPEVPVGADPIPGCLRPAEGLTQVEPIMAINGVQPDCAGNLTLQIVNVRETPGQPGLQVVTGPGKIELRDEGTPCGS